MKRIFGHTIFKQLVLFSLLISVLPVIAIFSLLFAQMEDMVASEQEVSHQQMVLQYTKIIEEKLYRYQESISFIANNTALIEAMTFNDGNPQQRAEKISEEVAKSLLLDRPSEIWNCMVYSMDMENPMYGSRVTMINMAEKEPWYSEERMTENGWFYYYSQVGNTYILALVNPIFDVNIQDYTKRQLGSVKLNINLNKLLQPAGEGSYAVLVYDDEKQLLYTSDQSKKEEFQQYITAGEMPDEDRKSVV